MMVLLILVCIISLIPSIALYLWLRDRSKKEETFKKICRKALVRGIVSIVFIILLSGVIYILLRLTGLQNKNALLYEALYTFIVLALAEEIVKYLTFRKTITKTDYPFSWLDVTVVMTVTAIGFGLIECIIYALGASVPVILIRGISFPHAGYGFIVGYFYGRAYMNNKPRQKWIGFVIAWLLHGLYDFSLSEEFVAINEGLMAVSLLLAILEIVLVIVLIVFVRKARNQERYTKPLQITEKTV